MEATLENAIAKYVDYIKADYISWQNRISNTDPVSVAVRDDMTQRFVNSVKVEVGSKYAKIVTNGGAHSFVVLKDGKFPRGSILKAASWAAPATNFVRGNVLNQDFNCATWTGAA